MTDAAADAHSRLAEWASPAAPTWRQGLRRGRALLTKGEAAKRGHSEAVARLGKTRFRAELARIHPLYGEWLHQQQRRHSNPRDQLRTAHDMLEAMGIEGSLSGPGAN